MTPPLLSVSGVAVRFGPLRALDGVDLAVRPGELVALAGENGAGKTTLVRCIAGDIRPTTGKIVLDGRQVTRDPAAAARQGIAVVWQDLALCDNLDVASNLLLGQERRGSLLSDVRFHTTAASVLRSYEIPLPDTTRTVRSLSGGQRQLVAVARAMARSPRLLLLDEPTAALGVSESAQVEELIARLRERGTTILLACHDIDQMFRLADRIVVLRHGRVVADVVPDQVHPDDVVALVSGQQVDSSARRQLTRLHGLADRLVSADPSSSLSLILSALGAALGSERLCIHLLAGDALVCAASLGLPDALLSAWSRLPRGPAGGPAGLAAATEQAVVDNVRAGAAWAPFSDLARAAKVASSWSVPVMGPGGLLGVITVFRSVTGQPHRDELDLVTLYAGYAASAIERDRLLDEVTARNRVLETIREMLETLAGPIPVAKGLVVALQALRRGLQADQVALLTRAPDSPPRCRAFVTAGRPAGRRQRRPAPCSTRPSGCWPSPRRDDVASPLQVDGQQLLAVTFSRARGAHGAAGGLARRAARRRRHRADGGRRPLAAAGARARGGRARAPGGDRAAPLAGTAARLPVPAEPRAAHAADGDQGLRLQPDAAGRDLGRGLAAAVPAPDRGGVGAARPAGRRPARLLRDRVGDPAPAAGLVRHLAWCSTRPSRACPPAAAAMVEVDCDPALPVVWADHDRLEQVFVNLLDNALGHNPPGTRVSVSAPGGRPGRDLGQRARRRHRDAARDRQRAVRADAAPPHAQRRRRARAVHRQGNRGRPRRARSSWSSPGRAPASGSTCRSRCRPGRTARLPSPPRARPGPRQATAVTRRPRPGGGPEPAVFEHTANTRALVVEDDPNIVDLIRSNLAVRGFDTVVSTDGVRALQLLETEEPDIVLLDLMLPEVDGFELCRQIRERSSVAIIVVSARGGERDKVTALNVGADDYMTKPFSIEELLARITATLRRTRPATAPEAEPGRHHHRRPGDRPGQPAGDERRAAGAPHPDRVRAAARAGHQPRQAADPRPPAAAGVGARLRDRDRVRAGLRPAAAGQAGGGRDDPADPDPAARRLPHRGGITVPCRSDLVWHFRRWRASPPAPC